MRKTRPQKLVDYTVVYTNGKAYNVFVPKMSNAKLTEMFRADARSEGTELKYFYEKKNNTTF